MSNLKKFLFLLSSREKKLSIFLFFQLLIMAFLDMIGVASILPFITVLTNPELIESNKLLNLLYQNFKMLGVKNDQQFLLSLGLLVFLLLVISLSFKALTTYVQYKFVLMREYSISRTLLTTYLYQPYTWFLNRSTANLGKSILSETSTIVGAGLKPLIDLAAQAMVILAILGLLVIVDPKLVLYIGGVIGLAYGIIFKFAKKYLYKIGQEREQSNEFRYDAVIEAFGAAKEIKTTGLEDSYIKKFSHPAQIYAKKQAQAVVIADLPRFALEAIAFGGILLIIIYLISQTGSFNSALPIISLYAFAGYRILPAINRIYVAISKITFISPSLDKVYKDLKNLEIQKLSQDQRALGLQKMIKLKNVIYSYPNSSKPAINDISLSIPSRSCVGFVGTTGSGKTTIIDIILGLLRPQHGFLEIDDKVLTDENIRSWQRSIGYVPQNIYLADDTISANIAFGLESKKVDQNKVETACKIANLHDFIIEDLPQKYQTHVGERGVRLSGGQRQRIGIARALYHNPEILILDEATSALDVQTEKAVMDAVNNLGKNITIILIAHRLNTVKNCDLIFKLEKGNLISRGTFEELKD